MFRPTEPCGGGALRKTVKEHIGLVSDLKGGEVVSSGD